jgi:hypothetical protein
MRHAVSSGPRTERPRQRSRSLACAARQGAAVYIVRVVGGLDALVPLNDYIPTNASQPAEGVLLSSAEWKRTAPPRGVVALEKLCADRELETVEIVEPNAYYGIADVIKRWAGTPRERPLMIALPHGVEYESAKFFTHYELVPVIASYCPDAARPYRHMPIGRLWYIASPYVHVVAMTADRSDVERHGSVFFPQHSTTIHKVSYDVAGTVEQLRALPARYHPITVCIYCVDVRHGVHRAYLDAGFGVVSAGGDSAFLYRLHRICIEHSFAIHHDYGSAVAFSIKSGCQAMLIDGSPIWQPMDNEDTEESLTNRGELLAPEHRAFRDLVGRPYRDQLAWADHVLGSRFLRTPNETAAMIRRAERLDRMGFFAERGLTGRRNPFTIPTVYRRAIRRAVPISLRRPLHPVIRRLRVHSAD